MTGDISLSATFPLPQRHSAFASTRTCVSARQLRCFKSNSSDDVGCYCDLNK